MKAIGAMQSLSAAVVAAIIVAVWCMCIAWRLGPPPEAVPVDTQHVAHVVGIGDTLWGIAQRYRPTEDPRRVIAEIQHDNEVGSIIHPGDIILVRQP